MENAIEHVMEEMVKIDQAIEYIRSQHDEMLKGCKEHYEAERQAYKIMKHKVTEERKEELQKKEAFLAKEESEKAKAYAISESQEIKKQYTHIEDKLIEKLFNQLFLLEE